MFAGFDSRGQRYSLLQYVLHETEQLHAKLRRYTSPDEHPFFEVAAPLVGQAGQNASAFEAATGITTPGDDSNYGSAGVLDVLCLQALSKRIHYGKFVAEAKFRYGKEKEMPWTFWHQAPAFRSLQEKWRSLLLGGQRRRVP
eukprot:56302-Pelagomonas_calceolata.AAC.5